MRISRGKIIIFSMLAALLVGMFVFLRSPYVSNALKKAVLEKIYIATGHQVIAEQMYINLLPPFVGFSDIKAFDSGGTRVFAAKRIKAYLSLARVFLGEISIGRLVVSDSGFWGTDSKVEELVSHARQRSLEKKRGYLKVAVKSIVLDDADISYFHEKTDTMISAVNTDLDLHLGGEPEAVFSIEDLGVSVGDLPQVGGNFRGSALFSGDMIRMENLVLEHSGSEVSGSARIKKGGPYVFQLESSLREQTVMQVLGHEMAGDGTVNAEGMVVINKPVMESEIDLKLSGVFHLETLLAALGVNDKFGLAGRISLDGTLSGPLMDLQGKADASMTDGNLFRVKPDRIDARVEYADGRLSFFDAKADIYGGKADGEVWLLLPKIREYHVDLRFEGAEIDPVKELIYIGWLDLPDGRVEGSFFTSGQEFSPRGDVIFSTEKERGDPLGRINSIRGSYEMEGGVLRLDDMNVRTDLSQAFFEGSLDLNSDELDFDGYLLTTSINDLVSPYYGHLKGGGRIDASVGGTLDAPVISGNANMWGVALDDYVLGLSEARFTLDRKGLVVPSASSISDGSTHAAKGKLAFTGDSLVPSVDEIEYDISISAREGNLGRFLGFLGLGYDVEGVFDTDLRIEGSPRDPDISGEAMASDIIAYGRVINSGSLGYAYRDRTFSMMDAAFSRAGSRVLIEGNVSLDGSFEFRSSSPGAMLSHLAGELPGVEGEVSFIANGTGTFEDPSISIEMDLVKGVFKGYSFGDIKAIGRLSGDSYSIRANSSDNKVRALWNGSVSGEMPWNAELSLGYRRYDFILGPFLEEAPEDLVLGIESDMSLSGSRGHFSADAVLKRILFSVYGQGFTNLSEANVSLRDRRVSVDGLKMRGGNSTFELSGDAEVGESLDLRVKGTSSLVPLPAFIDSLEAAKGALELDGRISGPWNSPDINGIAVIAEGMLSFKGKPQRISEINGTVRFEDGIAMTDRLSASLGGGEVVLNGQVDMDGLRASAIKLEAKLKDVSYYVSRNFSAKFGGELAITGDSSSQRMSGELLIEGASYKERIQWKSWLVRGGVPTARIAAVDWRRNVHLNVRVFGSDNIIIENNLADASLMADMVLKGTLASPVLIGRIESNKGKIFFRSAQFNIIKATADYSDSSGSSPYINIRAQTSVGGYFVWLTLEGRLQQMDLTLSSDPPLSDVEILGLLTLGGSGSNVDSLEGGVGAAEATSFLTGQVQDAFEGEVTEMTGLDRVQIAPSISSETGEVVPRVSASKRLLGEKLFVTYSSTVGAEKEEELKLEYLLGENISLIGGQESTGSIGGDLKFRFRFE